MYQRGTQNLFPHLSLFHSLNTSHSMSQLVMHSHVCVALCVSTASVTGLNVKSSRLNHIAADNGDLWYWLRAIYGLGL